MEADQASHLHRAGVGEGIRWLRRQMLVNGLCRSLSFAPSSVPALRRLVAGGVFVRPPAHRRNFTNDYIFDNHLKYIS